jgi:cytochrome P450 family 6
VGVVVPVMGIHDDLEYYPNPEEFDPERFNQANKWSRPQYSYLRFGEGPRNCIGLCFGLVETKVVLTALLKNYKVTVNEKTKEPLEFLPNTFILGVKGDIWLNVEKI